MARLPRYECDRCGARYDKNRALDVYGRWEQNLVGMSLVNTDGRLMRFDLCDECLEELQNWLQRSEESEESETFTMSTDEEDNVDCRDSE